MKVKRVFIILIVFFLLLSISSVYAGDICNETNMTNEITINDEDIVPISDFDSDSDKVYNDEFLNDSINLELTDKIIINNRSSNVQSNYILANDLIKYYKGDNQYYATFYSDLYGNLLTNAVVIIQVNGVNYTRTTNSSGMIKVNINLSPGEYIIKAYHPNGEEQDNLIKILPTIEGQTLNMFYHDGSKFTVRILDKNGNPLSDSIVNFNINGVLYNKTTNSTGHASLNINLLANIYIITVKSFYNDLQMSYAINIFYTVNKNTNNAIITPVKKCVYEGEPFVAKLCQENGLPLAGEQLNILIDGNSSYVTTDEKGFIYLSTSSLNVGTHNLHIYYGSNHVQSNLIVSSRVSGNDNILNPINTVIWRGNSFQVELMNSTGNPLNNVVVYFFINGVTYTKITNSTGHASLNINLNPGVYPIAVTSASTTLTNYNPVSIYKLIYVVNNNTDSSFNLGTYPDIYNIDYWVSPNSHFNTSNYIDLTYQNSEYIQGLSSFLTIYDDPLENIISINNYVSYTNYEYYGGTTKSAIETLNSFGGNCVDETNAVVSLARAAGIPARYTVGISAFGADNHAWGHFLIDGVWICFDTSTTDVNGKWEGDFKLGNKEYLLNSFNTFRYYLFCFNQALWLSNSDMYIF